jgi:general secretion pathway protein G
MTLLTASRWWRTPRRGFTLIELLVVLAIIATLLTIAMPRYYRSVDHSRDVALRQTLTVVRDALDKYAADTGRYPATLAELVEKGYLRKPPLDPITDRTDTWIPQAPPDGIRTGIYNIRSGAPGDSEDGTPYRDL